MNRCQYREQSVKTEHELVRIVSLQLILVRDLVEIYLMGKEYPSAGL